MLMQHLSINQQQVYAYYQKHFLLSDLPIHYFEDLYLDIAQMTNEEYARRHFSLSQNEMKIVLTLLLAEIKAEQAALEQVE